MRRGRDRYILEAMFPQFRKAHVLRMFRLAAFRRPLRGAAALAAALVVLAPPPARAERPPGVALDYEVYAGGLHIASSDVELRVGTRAYAVSVSAAPRGILRWFGDWSFTAASNGEVNGRIDPKGFSTASRNSRQTKTRSLSYGADGSIEVAMNPVEEGDPVPEALQAGTVDPLSGAVLMVAAVTAGQGCDRTVPVYDGRRRFDLVFADLGRQVLRPSAQASFSGEALHCQVRLERIAGSWQNRHSSGFWRRDDGETDPRRRQMDIFLAEPLAGGPMVPVRAEGQSSAGPILIHLRSAAALAGDAAEAGAAAPPAVPPEPQSRPDGTGREGAAARHDRHR